MNHNYFGILSILLLVSLFVTVYVSAEEQVPGSILMVETDPYYFSEGDFGLKFLKFFQRSLSPYLVPGKTTEQSTIQEISEVYNEARQSVGQKAIVDENNRAMTYAVEFSGGDLQNTYRFDTFQKFTHITKDQNNSPYYYQNLQYGLELESLPSEDKKLFYDEMVIPSINPGKNPEPFDVTVDVLVGDGTTLQSWKYTKCTINSYTPYLDENLVKLKFVGDFASEIKDKTAFSCDGFTEDFSLKKPSKKPEATLFPIIPTKETRAERIIAQFSGGELKNTATFYSFSKFTPVAKNPTFPISIPGNVIGEKPRFALESLPTTDKENYYAFLSRYINPGKIPEPFDATIHLITGNDNILQSWQYKDCSANNYVVFFTDNLIRFKQTLSSEIRDKTYFECSGLSLDTNPDKNNIDTKQPVTIDKQTSAQTFVVHFQGSDITPERTVSSFTKFFPITNEEIQFLLPNSPFGEDPKFYLESLPSKDNEWYYQLMSKYINAGKIPEPFDVTVDVLVGDGTTLQSLEYKKCQVLEYKTYLEDSLFLRKFTNKFEKEFRDRTIFQCVGYAFDATLHKSQKPLEKPLDYSDFVPSEQSRITQMTATFSDGDLEKPFVVNTIGKFTPKIEQRHQTQTQVVKFDVTVIPNAESGGGASPTLFGPPDYCEPGQNPPGCRPCPPNNPNCSDESGGGGECEDSDCITEPPIEPEEPGISTPSYTVLVTMPHLSITQKNDYIKSTEFTLMSLPSKDKLPYYDMVSKYINPGKKPELFDVTLDYLSSDGTVIQSWKYSSCEIKDFKIKRNGVLLTFPLSNIFGAADIVETSTLSCNGFSVDFDQKNNNSEVNFTIPTPYDRAMLHLTHWYGGELQSQRSSALLQEFNTLGDSNLSVGGLPNIHHKDAYQFISRYVNPGKTPEPLDMRFDTVTGDGTILFSTNYNECTIKDASTYLSDNMALIRYTPSLKSEIHGNSLIDCIGTSFKVSPQNDSKFDHSGNLRKVSPIIQTSIGVPAEDVSCKEEFTLMIRPPNNVPICIKNDDTSQFEERGWKIPSQKEKKNIVDILRPILPSESERALSFTVSFEGTDISPSQTVETFSKFVPISNEDSIIQTPSNPLDSSEKAFYLESLPSKEKNWFYALASRYVNAGAEPEKFNVTVHVNDGKGDVLQDWNYRECEIAEFSTYYDDNLLRYKFHGKWQSEIKDKSVFSCVGLTINS